MTQTDNEMLSNQQHALLGDELYHRIKSDILSRKLEQGIPLNEALLGQQYAGSRTPVRQALLRLQQEGFVEKSGRILCVRSFTFEAVRELYELREALEKMTVRLCIERATNAELEALAQELDAYDQFDLAVRREAFNRHANGFHRSLARLARNETLRRQLDHMLDLVLMVNARWFLEGTVEGARQGHAVILEAIMQRDVTVAEAAMRTHIMRITRLFAQQTLGIHHSEGTNIQPTALR